MPVTPSLPPLQWSIAVITDQVVTKSARAIHEDVATLSAINVAINKRLYPHIDAPLATEGWRDTPIAAWCGDYALTKRNRLIESGWIPAHLLLAEVIVQNGEHHAVLLATTLSGYLVLDNLTNELRAPRSTGYKFVRTQNPHDPDAWLEGMPE